MLKTIFLLVVCNLSYNSAEDSTSFFGSTLLLSLVIGHRSYQCVITRLWNNLPDYLRRAPSLNIFKSMLDEVNLTTRVECDCNFCT